MGSNPISHPKVILFILLAVLNVIDLYQTSLVSVCMEGNPLMAWVWRNHGFEYLMQPKVIGMLVILSICLYVRNWTPKREKYCIYGLIGGVLIMLGVVAGNTYVLLGP